MNVQKKFPSSVDVARRAGVSQSAVSRAFAEKASISSKTRAKVFAAAAELGYRPSAIPRIMLTHRSHLVAIATGGMYNPFQSRILELFTRGLNAMGYQLILVHVEAGDSLEAAMPQLASYRVDAVLVARGVLDEQSAAAVASYRIPIVAFHTPVSNPFVSSVCVDSISAGRQMAAHFAARGARRCAFVGGPFRTTTDRLAGFRAVLAERGLAEPIAVPSAFTYEGGRGAAQRLLAATPAPDAVFCANDLVAIGFIDVARQLGLRVPEDVMVAGFDDIPEANWSSHSITSFSESGVSMVEASLDILKQIGEATAQLPVQVVLPVRLIERNSTRRNLPPL
jgi:DNA-binding LacI/PurR family transcriptional regulator